MSRLVVRFSDGTHVNLPADYIDIREEWIIAWKGDFITFAAKASLVDVCYLSEKKEG